MRSPKRQRKLLEDLRAVIEENTIIGGFYISAEGIGKRVTDNYYGNEKKVDIYTGVYKEETKELLKDVLEENTVKVKEMLEKALIGKIDELLGDD